MSVKELSVSVTEIEKAELLNSLDNQPQKEILRRILFQFDILADYYKIFDFCKDNYIVPRPIDESQTKISNAGCGCCSCDVEIPEHLLTIWKEKLKK